jgi:hypothetical protein
LYGIASTSFDLTCAFKTNQADQVFEHSLINHLLHVQSGRGDDIVDQLRRIRSVDFNRYFGLLPTPWKLAESSGAG